MPCDPPLCPVQLVQGKVKVEPARLDADLADYAKGDIYLKAQLPEAPPPPRGARMPEKHFMDVEW